MSDADDEVTELLDVLMPLFRVHPAFEQPKHVQRARSSAAGHLLSRHRLISRPA
ncbi:hypothetical protein ACH4S8_44565 [Streptomyces sp. NPDC021080]|uniref:hypothetical protein n=1 Tax=Streptomyces sp. NPDC021080 TaxID=3365110 RepID=UPI003797D976